jgi:ribose 1,5-bisphosphokinase PhnN
MKEVCAKMVTKNLTTNTSVGGAELLPRIEKNYEWLNRVAIMNESSVFSTNLRQSGRECIGNPQPHTVPRTSVC